jgi:hypothetical protein
MAFSNELSVTPTEDGRYFLTYTLLGISDKIGISVGKSPVGPFGETTEVVLPALNTRKKAFCLIMQRLTIISPNQENFCKL